MKNLNAYTVADMVYEARKKKNYSRRQIAKMINVDRFTITIIEHRGLHHSGINIVKYIALCDHLDIEPTDGLRDTENY